MSDRASPRIIYDLGATLVVLSPLHVGSGGTREVPTVVGKEGANRPPEVSEIVRDADDAPYLPGTTIKGLLRRLAEARHGVESEVVRRLFGSIKETEGRGAPGRVTVFGARCIAAPAVPDAPFVAGATDVLGRGVFVAARTRIDPATGTAGDHTLFHQEMVAQDTTFALRLRIDTRAGVRSTEKGDKARLDQVRQTEAATGRDRDARPAADEALDELIALLGTLCAENGHAIGKGQTDGLGRVRLDPASLVVAERVLQPDGSFAKRPIKRSLTRPSAASGEVLRLVCDGPFIVMDASKKRKQGGSDDSAEPHIAPQMWRERLPMLLGTSVSGALRARARWLEMRRLLREKPAGRRIGDVDPGGIVWKKTSESDELSSVQRLFGVTGLRGRLAIERLHVAEATPWDVTSVKLDRFTGGPIDNALFKTRTFVGVKLELTLRLTPPRSDKLSDARHDEDQALFEALLDDIRANGLMLGHGGNKGFGWFRHEGARR